MTPTACLIWNYLRVRGEYGKMHQRAREGLELPPRARRIQWETHFPALGRGTTSACAENTAHMSALGVVDWNYLRVRGEYSIALLGAKCLQELPPRARRIHQVHPTDILMMGTTSACAENTGVIIGCMYHLRNYLRVRGEYPK